MGFPSSEHTLAVCSYLQSHREFRDFRIPPDARTLSIHPGGEILACVSGEGGDRIELRDPQGVVLSHVEIDPGESVKESLTFDPSGNFLYLTCAPVEDGSSPPHQLLQLSADSLSVQRRFDLQGAEYGRHYSSWLPSKGLLQIEINSGPNGYLVNYIRCAGGLFEEAIPSLELGEGLFSRLLPDGESVIRVSSSKASVTRIETSELVSETFFESSYSATGRPAALDDLVIIPLYAIKKEDDWQLLVLDSSLSEVSRIPLPDLAGYSWLWCEGRGVVAERREAERSEFQAWEMI